MSLECRICWDPVAPIDLAWVRVSEDDSSHRVHDCFHEACVQRWVESTDLLGENPSCPLCRRTIVWVGRYGDGLQREDAQFERQLFMNGIKRGLKLIAGSAFIGVPVLTGLALSDDYVPKALAEPILALVVVPAGMVSVLGVYAVGFHTMMLVAVTATRFFCTNN